MASGRKNTNRIKELRRGDGSVVEEEYLTNYVCSFFQELFTSTAGDRVNELIDKVTPHVTSVMHDVLDATYTIEEVKAALDHIGDLKAPGPDGMPLLFSSVTGISWVTMLLRRC